MNNGSIVISISSRVVDSIYGNSQAPIRSYVMKRAEAFEQESLLPKLFRMERSRHWAEQYGGETAMENFVPVGEGGSYPLTGFEESFQKTLVNETWKQSFAITRELVDDAQLGKMKQRANKLMTSYYRTREMFGRNLYAGGLLGTEVQIGGKKFSTAAADGKKLFATDHIAKVKGNKQSNAFAGDFTAANLDAVETMMQNTKGDNGELLAIAPDTILIPNDAKLKRQVFEVVGADKDPDSGDNGFNFQFGRWNVIVDPYLTMALQQLGVEAAPWILLDSKFIQENDGAIWQDRVKLELSSEIDDNNDNNKWKGYARFTGGFVDWRFAAAGGVNGGTAL